jgi:hypothetical protein
MYHRAQNSGKLSYQNSRYKYESFVTIMPRLMSPVGILKYTRYLRRLGRHLLHLFLYNSCIYHNYLISICQHQTRQESLESRMA